MKIKAVIGDSKSLKKEIWETQAILYFILGNIVENKILSGLIIGYGLFTWCYAMFRLRKETE